MTPLFPVPHKPFSQKWCKQTDHRIALEANVVASDIWRSWAGLIMGFLLAVAVLACGTWLVSQNHDTAGAIFVSSGMAGIASVFVVANNKRNEDLQKKAALAKKVRDSGTEQ